MLSIAFLFFVNSAKSQIYLATESFDGTTFVPTGWTNFLTSGSNTWTRVTAGTFPTCATQSGAGMAKFNSYDVNGGVRSLISPVMNFSTVGTKRISFWMYRDNGYNTTADKIEVLTNTAANTTGATLVGTVNRAIGLSPTVAANGWYNYTFDVTTTSATTYLILRATSAYGNNIYIDNVGVAAPPACAVPTALTSSAITSTSATISWTAASPAPASGYQYYYSTSATAPTAGTTPSGSTAAGVTTASLTGLTANTTYYFWVRSNCGGSGTSTWAGSSTFFTGYCQPTGTSGYTINSFVTTNGITNISNSTGGNGGYGNFTAQAASNSVGSPTNFTVTHSATGGGAGVGVWIDWNNDLDFADANEQIAITTGWNYSPFSGVINIPVGATVGNRRLRVVLDYNAITPSSCPVGISGETEDYTFTVAAPPSCAVPTGLTSSAITSTSATISWTAASPAPASGYQYYYSTSATAPTAGTTPSGSTAAGVVTANITGLTANTTYYFWVRSNCGGSGTSTWAGSSTFFTGYCQPSGTGVSTSITNVTTSGGITNLANASGFTAGGYANYTAFSCSQSAGGTINFTLTYVSDPGTKIFIDWNNDLDFNDAGENVYSSNAYVVSTVSGSFTVPVGQAIGNYRMRIVADWNSTTPVACPVNINGETEDYTFTVAAPPSCVAPTGLVGTPLTLTSATISWTAASPAPASGYQYYVSSSSTPPTAGTTPTGSTSAGVTSANLTSLTIGTTYYFWVRSVCSVSDLSSWAGASSFYVGYCVPVTTYGCTDGDVIARVVLNTLDNNSGTGCPSGLAGYSDYTTNPSLTTTLLPSSTYNCTVYAGQYAEGYAAWIDYNDDGVFNNTTERIGYSNGQVAGSGIVGALGSSASFPITLACTPPAGVHRLRVRAMYFTDGINVTPCTSNFYGETEDYLITIAPAPACPSPGLISNVTATSSSVTLTWLTGCSSSTTYDFEYGPVGFTSGTGTLVSNQTVTISAPNASFTVTGLQAGTNYSIYYRANCGSSTSAWSLVNNFTTLNGVSSASSTPTLCQGTVLTSITHTTQGATGIGTATGLPTGVTASWSANVITISGTPSASGVFSYSIPLTGGLGTVSATGTITVLAAPAAAVATSPQQFCETSNSTIASIQYSSVSGSSYLWYSTSTGGSSLATTQQLTIGTSTYYLEVIGGNGCVSLTRTPVVVTENSLLTASVSITGTTACPGGVLLFTATPVNGGTSPTYQWYNGGVAIPGENQSTYSAVGLAPGDVINVKMVPSGSCVTVCQ